MHGDWDDREEAVIGGEGERERDIAAEANMQGQLMVSVGLK